MIDVAVTRTGKETGTTGTNIGRTGTTAIGMAEITGTIETTETDIVIGTRMIATETGMIVRIDGEDDSTEEGEEAIVTIHPGVEERTGIVGIVTVGPRDGIKMEMKITTRSLLPTM